MLPDIQPFTPYLSVNEDPQICAAYEAAWLDIYRGKQDISERWMNLEETFPDASHIVPSEGQGAGGYAHQARFEFDYDGDGDMEVIYFESVDQGWRYLGTGVYLYDSVADFDADAPVPDETGRNYQNNRFGWQGDPANSRAKQLAYYPKLSGARVIQLGGRLLSQSNITFEGRTPGTASLDWLRPDEEPAPICEIKLSPAPSPITANPASQMETGRSQVAAALGSVYGGPESGGQICYGSMGWTAQPPSVHWAIINHRPQAIREGYPSSRKFEELDLSEAADTAREFRFVAWGLKDPTSFETVNALKAAYPKFISEHRLYYQIYFGMDEAVATQTAERAYRYLLDRVFYARQTGPQFYPDLMKGVTAGPRTPLSDIANQVVEKAIAYELSPEKAIHSNHQKGASVQYHAALKLGLLAGGQTDRLLILSERLKVLPDASLTLSTHWQQLPAGEKRQFMLDELFLASLNNPVMMKHFLELGAQVDIATNYFGKTALMYAAQNDDLGAVTLLLSNGADPNRITEHDGSICKRALTRDARTPLFYAAQYASPTLIMTLLEAGADPAAKDSQGNDAPWYLEQNTNLSQRQKDVMKARLAR